MQHDAAVAAATEVVCDTSRKTHRQTSRSRSVVLKMWKHTGGFGGSERSDDWRGGRDGASIRRKRPTEEVTHRQTSRSRSVVLKMWCSRSPCSSSSASWWRSFASWHSSERCHESSGAGSTSVRDGGGWHVVASRVVGVGEVVVTRRRFLSAPFPPWEFSPSLDEESNAWS